MLYLLYCSRAFTFINILTHFRYCANCGGQNYVHWIWEVLQDVWIEWGKVTLSTWKIINRTCINCKKHQLVLITAIILSDLSDSHILDHKGKRIKCTYTGEQGKQKLTNWLAEWQHAWTDSTAKVWTPFKLFDLKVKVWQKTQTMTPNSHVRQLTKVKVFFNTEIAVFLMRNLSVYILTVNVSQISNVNL